MVGGTTWRAGTDPCVRSDIVCAGDAPRIPLGLPQGANTIWSGAVRHIAVFRSDALVRLAVAGAVVSPCPGARLAGGAHAKPGRPNGTARPVQHRRLRAAALVDLACGQTPPPTPLPEAERGQSQVF